jgi:hypothetical protein
MQKVVAVTALVALVAEAQPLKNLGTGLFNTLSNIPTAIPDIRSLPTIGSMGSIGSIVPTGLPTVSSLGSGLPTVTSLGSGLPTVTSLGSGLPTLTGLNSGLNLSGLTAGIPTGLPAVNLGPIGQLPTIGSLTSGMPTVAGVPTVAQATAAATSTVNGITSQTTLQGMTNKVVVDAQGATSQAVTNAQGMTSGITSQSVTDQANGPFDGTFELGTVIPRTIYRAREFIPTVAPGVASAFQQVNSETDTAFTGAKFPTALPTIGTFHFAGAGPVAAEVDSVIPSGMPTVSMGSVVGQVESVMPTALPTADGFFRGVRSSLGF